MTRPHDQDAAPPRRASGAFTPARITPVVIIVLLMVFIFAMGWHRQLSLETLVRHRAALEELVATHFLAALAAYMLFYIAAASLSIPGSAILSLAGGVLFGTLVGGSAVIVAATTGGTIIFLIARSAFGEFVARRAGPRAAKLAAGFRADAFRYLLFLRLVPVFPFFLVNLAPALAGVALRPFVAATALGIIPATFVYASVGAGLDSVIAAQAQAYQACLAAGRSDCRLEFHLWSAFTPQLIAAFAGLTVLALIPVIVRWVYGKTPEARADDLASS